MSSAASSSISQVRVAVRARPLTSAERGRGGKDVVNVSRHSKTVAIGNGAAGRSFTYDSVFDSSVSQLDFYRDISGSLLGSFLDGYNATILAYGQTGSGKTFTMGSEALQGYDCNVDSIGLLPRFMEDIFASVANQRKKQEQQQHESTSTESGKDISYLNSSPNVEISASFLEVYGEDVFDLLVEHRSALSIREDSNGEVIVSGLKKVPVASVEEAMDVLNRGTMQRTTASTLMNSTSSRSHAVFTISMIRTESNAQNDVAMTASSRMTFVDLAGSERMKRTGAEGERAKEGIKINEGLLALGNVINALADEERLSKGGKVHVPYRQSKLTRLLQDALGGNSQTLFLACVSPSDTNASETLCTLQYANRARNIKNAVTKNLDPTLMELQRLNILTGVLQHELLKNRFMQCHSLPTINEVDAANSQSSIIPVSSHKQSFESYQDLLQRNDVQEYMEQLYLKVAEKCQGNPNSSFKVTHQPSTNTSSPSPLRDGIMNSPIASMRRVSGEMSIIAHDDINAALQDLNPDDDMAMLDQLLDLQREEKEFDEIQKMEKGSLEKVEGELKEQENMLLQLRENMKMYHTIKAKYEALMVEVLNLEKEKARLAEDLDKALTDPTKGCSKTLQQKLGGVEVSLARARGEARKHQSLYRKAEQEAQKCKILERKVKDLKHGKTELIRKQREASAKHREYTETKTREINNFKKKERINGQKVSKLELECRRQQATLERRKLFCDKLNSKLKETEKHLMKYLKVRTREKNDIKAGSGKKFFNAPENSDFAPMSKEIQSVKFLLDRTIIDRVKDSYSTELYKEKMVLYGDLMQALVNEVKNRNNLKQMAKSEWCKEDIEESEQNIECIEVQLELIGSELNDLREMLPEPDGQVEKNNSKGETKSKEANVQQMVAKLSGASARTLVWEFLNDMTTSEFHQVKADEVLKRKELTIQSFESEVDILNKKLKSVSSDFERRKVIANKFKSSECDDLLGRMLELENEILKLNKILQTKDEVVVNANKESAELKIKLEKSQCNYANQKEKMILYEAADKNKINSQSADKVLNELQTIWSQLGVTGGERRERARSKMDTCLEDACNALLDEAKDLQRRKNEEVNLKQKEVFNMFNSLGCDESEKTQIEKLNSKWSTVNQRMGTLQDIHLNLYPKYFAAVQRREKIALEVQTIVKTMEPLEFDLRDNLQRLLSSQGKGLKRKRKQNITLISQKEDTSREKRAKAMQEVEKMLAMLGETTDENEDIDKEHSLLDADVNDMDVSFDELESGLLSSTFLDDCEKDLKCLRQRKAEMMAHNNETLVNVKNLVEKMHLTGKETNYLVNKLIVEERKDQWWSPVVSKEICYAVSAENPSNVVEVNGTYTRHLNLVYESLHKIAKQRSIIAEKLKYLLNDAYMTIVKKVKIREVHESFQEFKRWLISLPSLSREYVEAYIDEMNKLVSLVQNMFHSDREALIHVWERNCVTSSEDAMFWAQLEDLCKIEKTSSGVFDSIAQELNSSKDCVESWIIPSIKDAAYSYNLLEKGLFKWRKVNEELEIQVDKEQRINKVIELDGEINAMNFQLDNFELGSRDKQERLRTKKENSTWLLREEKYRKQMQTKFTSLLEELTRHLDEWEEQEGSPFNADNLSEDVRNLLSKDNKMRAVEERTAFMHLRTVKSTKKPRSGESKLLHKERKIENYSRESIIPPSTTKRTLDGPSHAGLVEQRKLETLNVKINNNGTATAGKSNLRHKTNQSRRLTSLKSDTKAKKLPSSHHRTPTKRKHMSEKASDNMKDSSNSLSQQEKLGLKSKSKSALKKFLSVNTEDNNDEKSSTILPFGNLLKTPTRQKENIFPSL